MTLSLVDYDSKADAVTAAEMAGYDELSIRVRRDRESGRYQWELRSFDAVVVADAEAASGADAAASVVASVIDGLTDVLADDTREESKSNGEDVTVSDIDVTNGWHGAAVDAVASGWTEITGGSESESPIGNTDVGAGAATVADAPVVSGNVVVAGDLVMQIHGALPEVAARQLAATLARQMRCVITLRRADTLEVVDHVVAMTGGGGGRSARTSGAASERAPAVERDWSVWADDEVPESNRTILRVKHGIEAALAASDLDALLAFDFSGAKVEDDSNPKVSTYYRRAGRYLRCAIAKCEAELAERAAARAAAEAALDAEFGVSAIA